ncbi:MAG: hypothetical protein ACRCWC_17945, partial [Plesiomonas shigelloides]
GFERPRPRKPVSVTGQNGRCRMLTHIELTFAATDRIDAVRNTVARLRAVYEPHFTVGKTEITRRGDHIIVSIPLGAK